MANANEAPAFKVGRHSHPEVPTHLEGIVIKIFCITIAGMPWPRASKDAVKEQRTGAGDESCGSLLGDQGWGLEWV